MAQPLTPIRLRELGQLGFFAESDELDGPQYASVLTNCVYDSKGRLASRKGWASYLASAVTGTPSVTKLHYYAKEIGDTEHWIAAGDDDKLYKLAGAVGAGTATDITGAITTPSADNWQFVNYNNYVVGLQQDDNPVGWNGTGNFADYGSGAALPDGNCLLSAWGRLFGTTADGQQINWTATLGSDFDAVGSGQLNVRLVWPDGKDQIVAIAAFNNRLVIFGKRNILIYGDSAASQLDAGVNPNSTSFGLVETVEGVGLYARDTVVAIGNDLIFLSPTGLRSLRRAVDYERMPMRSVSRNVDPDLIDYLNGYAPDTNACSLAYDQAKAMFLLRLDTKYYYFDARRTYNDDLGDPFYRASEWFGVAYKGVASGDDKNLRFGFDAGLIGQYQTYLDNATQYTMGLGSVWLSLERGQAEGERLKFLKRLVLFANTEKTYTVNLRWQWDFSQASTSSNVTVEQLSAPAEWGEDEWGESDWSGGETGSGVYKGTTTGSGSGTYLKIILSLNINDAKFAYTALNTQLKLGRLTR